MYEWFEGFLREMYDTDKIGLASECELQFSKSRSGVKRQFRIYARLIEEEILNQKVFVLNVDTTKTDFIAADE
jgi:hypothetical protein